MLTINKKASYSKAPGKKITNVAGGEAFNLNKRLELFLTFSTSLIYGNSFYEKASERLKRMLELVDDVAQENGGSEFICKLAIYLRNTIGIRDAALCLVLRLAKSHKGDNLISNTLYQVIDREDMIVTAMGMYSFLNEFNSRNYQYKNGKKVNLGKINGVERKKVLSSLSSQVKKGLVLALNNPKFNENSFAKNTKRFETKEIKLKDVLFTVHAKPINEEKAELFKKIINSNLETANTWETNLSALGQKYKNDPKILLEEKTKFWNEFILATQNIKGQEVPKLGFLALLRNLRNILEANVDSKTMEVVYERLSKGGKRIFPFQYLSAYREVINVNSKYTSSVLEALNNAIISSIRDFSGFGFDETVLIASDVSGSMQSTYVNSENVSRQLQRFSRDYSKQNEVKRKAIKAYDIGLVLGMMAFNKCKSTMFGVFGDSWKIVNVPKTNILDNVEKFYGNSGEIREGMVGYSTNGYLIVQDILNKKQFVDKVFIFTDCQLYGNSINNLWKKYKETINPNAKLYLFDLRGLGNSPLDIKDGVYIIGGFTEKIFDIMKEIDKGNELFNLIDNIKINEANLKIKKE